jgi:hypothetical protein
MYPLEDFIPFDGTVKDGNQVVLVWSQRTGYYFVQYGFTALSDLKIIAKQK